MYWCRSFFFLLLYNDLIFFQTLVQLATHFYLYLIWLFLIHFHFLLLYPVFIVILFCFSAFSVFHYQISDVYLSLVTKERIIKSNRYHWYTRYVVTGNFKLYFQQYFMHFFPIPLCNGHVNKCTIYCIVFDEDKSVRMSGESNNAFIHP